MSIKDYLFKKASYNRIPLSGTFELSPVCNFACKMCYVRKTRRQMVQEGQKEISVEQWLKLAEQCKDAGMLFLLLTGGEVFLYPGFKELYEKLHRMGFVISINSNGSMITEETVEWLKKFAPAKINITLYGASEETYGKICGNEFAYNNVVKAVLLLKEAGIQVALKASMIPENADDLKRIIQFAKEHELELQMGTYMFPPVRRDKSKQDSRFSPEEAGRMNVMKQFYSLPADFFEKEGKHLLSTLQKNVQKEEIWGYHADTMSCRAGRSTFWVTWDGKMTACGIMDFPSVQYPFEKVFITCWTELTNQVREKTVLEACTHCEKKEVCRPCAAIVHAETGDVNKKAEYLCQMTDATIHCWKEMLRKEERDEKK